MRISDWSSDVCSSDLFAVAVAGAEAERRIVPAARGRNALFGRADLVFERPERRVVLHRRGHPGLGVAAGRQLGTEIVRQALQVGDSGAGDLGQRLVGVGQGRSEEHTSELQSLMRISYAVFCLKNKNNIQ